MEGRSALNADQHAIMVSCRCNYTGFHYFCGLLHHLNYLKCLFIYFHQPFVSCFVLNVDSRLFFKQPTSWRPNISRDLLISVASEMSGQSSGPNGKVSQLPVQVVLLLHFFHFVEIYFFSHLLKLLSNSQVLALQASNLTSEDLTLTAPASFTSSPSVGSLTSTPTTPMSSFVGLSESAGIITGEKYGSAVQALSSVTTMSENMKWNSDGGVQSVSFIEQSSPISDVISSTGLGCTHLWLQSRVPLG